MIPLHYIIITFTLHYITLTLHLPHLILRKGVYILQSVTCFMAANRKTVLIEDRIPHPLVVQMSSHLIFGGILIIEAILSSDIDINY